jgi:predicted O-methyltransferase YrrM
MKYTKQSLELTENISNEMNGKTFHHHYHILYDIINTYPENVKITYVEIGCYAGGSTCLVLQRKNTNVFAIDLANPIPQSVVMDNVNKFNIHNNNFNYIKGSSHDINTLNTLKEFVKEIDILFIDGDHSFLGVKTDFNMYSPMVKSGGYVVFDDYNDKQYSPQVASAVDEIISTLNGYEIIGTLPNIFNARPSDLKDGNCFVIKKI